MIKPNVEVTFVNSTTVTFYADDVSKAMSAFGDKFQDDGVVTVDHSEIVINCKHVMFARRIKE